MSSPETRSLEWALVYAIDLSALSLLCFCFQHLKNGGFQYKHPWFGPYMFLKRLHAKGLVPACAFVRISSTAMLSHRSVTWQGPQKQDQVPSDQGLKALGILRVLLAASDSREKAPCCDDPCSFCALPGFGRDQLSVTISFYHVTLCQQGARACILSGRITALGCAFILCHHLKLNGISE